jgi:hypothetical protein
MSEVMGQLDVAKNLLALKSRTFKRVIEAVEKTAVRMANHARAGHEHGSNPHARSRYENQTSNLTNSIFPGGPEGMQWEELSEDRVVGLFGVNSAAAGSVMVYAPIIEEKYPFIWPAAVANIESFKQGLAEAAKPR